MSIPSVYITAFSPTTTVVSSAFVNLMPTDSEIEAVILETLRSADFDTATLKSIRRDVVTKLRLPADFFRNAAWKRTSADLADRVMDELEDRRRGRGRPQGATTKTSSIPTTKDAKRIEKRESAPEGLEAKVALNIVEAATVHLGDEAAAKKVKIAGDVRVDSLQLPSHGSKSKQPLPKKSTKRTTQTRGRDDVLEKKIATLKSWIVKCGVRKKWTRELAPYKTKKDVILHLQNILVGLGMTPRYSLEKAKKIRERREMEVEVAQLHGDTYEPSDAGNETDNEDNDIPNSIDPSKLKPTVVAGNFNIDFLGDQSSESD
ncbi:hypothetical protein V1525DRAFT_385722 [Lipomyces kononenkoae]|uniref:Uncharacterized protein n=1 Tax=Lipomyces kononenkoae TaxID=34357 RepID=A0ACC3T8U6_LIPKO